MFPFLSRGFGFWLVALSFLTASPDAVFAEDRSLPAKFELQGLSGGTLQPGDVKDRLLVLHFWAAWCVSCKDAMGILNEISSDPSLQFTYLPISVDDELEVARAYFKRVPEAIKPLREKSFLDKGGAFAELLGVRTIPTILVVDRMGKVRLSIVGHPGKDRIESLRALLKSEQPPK